MRGQVNRLWMAAAGSLPVRQGPALIRPPVPSQEDAP